MKKFTLTALLFLTLFLTSCAGFWQKVDQKGGIVGSYNGNWVIVNYSGGRIVDVWKLENTLVQSETQSDGWLFTDKAGNPVNIGGDAKAIRFNNKTADWNKYKEYHVEFDLISYEEFVLLK